jgi:hypothetical protein
MSSSASTPMSTPTQRPRSTRPPVVSSMRSPWTPRPRATPPWWSSPMNTPRCVRGRLRAQVATAPAWPVAQRQEIVGRARPTQESQAPQRCEAPTPSMRSVLRVRRWRGPGSGPRAAVGSPSALGVGGGPTLGGAGRERGPAAGVQSGDRCTRAHPCAVPWTEAARHARHGRQPAGAVLLGRRDHHHGAGVAVSGASFPRADRRGSRAREGDPGHRSVLATPTRSRSSGWIRSLLRRCCVPGRTADGSTLRPRSRCSPGWRRSLPTANR